VTFVKFIGAGGVRVERYFVRAKLSIWNIEEIAAWDCKWKRDAQETRRGIDWMRVQWDMGRTFAADWRISPRRRVALRAWVSEGENSTMEARESRRPELMRTVRIRDL
jgi:hypothetical protein